MAQKVLITTKNSVFGILNRIQGENEFRHAIDFPADTLEESNALKDEFINNELFEGEDYKQLFANQAQKVGNVTVSAVGANLIVDVEDYPNETLTTLLNKDYAIVEDTTNGLKTYTFYSIISSFHSKQSVNYVGDLDPFFTYANELKFINESMLLRGHEDRFNENDEFDFREDSVFNNPDTLDDKLNTRIPILIDDAYNNNNIYWRITNNSIWDKEYKNQKWLVMYFSTDEDEKVDEGLYNSTKAIIRNSPNEITQPYSVMVAPTEPIDVYVARAGSPTVIDNLSWNAQTLYRLFISSPYLLGITVTEIPPMETLLESRIPWVSSTQIATLEDPIIRGVEYDSMVFESNQTGPFTEFSIVPFKRRQTSIYYEGGGSDINSIPNKTHPMTNNMKPDLDNIAIGDLRDIKYEPKLLCFPYYSLTLKNIDGTFFEYHPNLLYNEDLSLLAVFTWAPEIWKTETYLVGGLYSNDHVPVVGYSHSVSKIANLAEQTNAWKEYVKSNQVSAASGIIKGVGFAALGAATAGLGTGLVMGAGVAAAASGVTGLASTFVSRQDIKRTPDSSSNHSSSLASDMTYAPVNDFLLEEGIIKSDMIMVADYFNTYGYNFYKNVDMNYYKTNRYYFNKLEAADIFNNLGMEVSTITKQLISGAFEKGITFWHYRDSNTWKGILNYKYENWEMGLLNETKKYKKDRK